MNGLIILLCRNTIAYTRACLTTLLAQSVPVDVLIIDNACSDGTTRFIAAQQHLHSNLFRMSFPEVQSVAHSWNEGLHWAWRRGHEEALVCNSDTELLPETYQQLVAYLRSHVEVGMITAVGVDKDPTYPTDLAVRPHPDYSCYMIARWAHFRVPFDEEYVGGYLEDSKNHATMHRAGIWCGSLSLGFLHHSSGTLKMADTAEAERINKNYLLNKARFYSEFGCVPGTKAYEALFTEATFGMGKVVAGNAKPL